MSYTPRIDEHGHECCTRITEDGSKAYGIRTASGTLAVCDACREHHATALRTNDDFAPPDSYAQGVAALRAAAAPLSRFEQDYRAARIEALAAEHVDNVAHGDGRLTVLSADDLSAYRAPDGYQLAIDAMRGSR